MSLHGQCLLVCVCVCLVYVVADQGCLLCCLFVVCMFILYDDVDVDDQKNKNF